MFLDSDQCWAILPKIQGQTMQIHQRFTIKELSHTKPGELIVFEFAGHQATGFTIEHMNNGTSLVAILSSAYDQNYPPHYDGIEQHQTVMSFGTDWVIIYNEATESIPNGGGTYSAVPGVIMVDYTGTSLRLEKPMKNITANPHRISLPDLTRASAPSSKAVPILNWSIWLSADDSSRPDATPFYSFKAP
jgi:hypothetical protein